MATSGTILRRAPVTKPSDGGGTNDSRSGGKATLDAEQLDQSYGALIGHVSVRLYLLNPHHHRISALPLLSLCPSRTYT